MDILKYKGYEGSTEIDMDRGVCRGKILFINDLVTYEAETPSKLKVEFEAAVDDYIDTCHQLNRDPQKSLKGQFNVRVPPELHRKAVRKAMENGVSLNEIVSRSLSEHLMKKEKVAEKISLIAPGIEKAFFITMQQWKATENQFFNFVQGSEISLKSAENEEGHVCYH